MGFIKKILVLKEPDEHSTLKPMYRKQPDILSAIANEISDDQDVLNVGAPVCTCFDGDDISSTLHVRVPNDIVESVKNIPTGNMLKFKCSLGYSQSMHTLLLVLDSDVTSMVRVVG